MPLCEYIFTKAGGMRAEKLETAVRREQIARATLGLIAEGGMRAVRIGAVARRVGVAPSAIYRHFSGKEDLLEAIVGLLDTRLRSNLELAKTSSDDPIEILGDLLSRQVGQIRENQAIPRIIFSDDFCAGQSERRVRVYGILRGFLAEVSGLIRAGQLEGRVRPDLDPQVAAVMFVGLFMPPGILWFLSGGEFDVTHQTREGWKVFRRSIEIGVDAAVGCPRPRKGAVRKSRGGR